MAPAEHFVQPPHWEYYILAYFFLAGLTGGAYLLGVLLLFAGDEDDRTAARIAFYASFGALILCPILLTIDLGQPLRFWHMLVDSREAHLMFRYWTPMQVGAWALLIFGFFNLVTFLWALADAGRLRFDPLRRLLGGVFGRAFLVVGAAAGLFIAGYTGVLLAVSNQPVWSDGWPLGGLFLASGLSGAAALLLLISRHRPDMLPSAEKLAESDRYFVILEAVLLILFAVTVALAGTLGRVLTGAWPVVWLLVLAGLAAPFVLHRRAVDVLIPSLLVLLGVLALRAVVILAPQF